MSDTTEIPAPAELLSRRAKMKDAEKADALEDCRDGIRQALAVIEVARSVYVDDDLDTYNMLGGLRRILESAEADAVKAGAST